jgi:capsule polysaccharide export protein KpsE/RkpR
LPRLGLRKGGGKIIPNLATNCQTRLTILSPQEAPYPRSLENTLLAFLVFSGIYLLISMTASILREQVST